MTSLFIRLFNMSLTASLAAVAVILVRLVFKKMPKKINVFLWALVGLRLIMPFSIQSQFSLVPDTEPLRQEHFAVSASPSSETALLPEWTTVSVSESSGEVYPTVAVESDGANTGHSPLSVLPAVWLGGVCVMFVYAGVSFLGLKRKTSASIEREKGVFVCDDINSPFILGIFSPEIFLPSSLTPEQRNLVLSHEKAHISRLDTLWKPLGFALLAVYWFNPVMWLAYILLCRDIELACDEKVIQNMQTTEKADYLQTLLDCSRPGKSPAACPLAFGETGVKTRVKNILNYKKPAFWVVIAAVGIVIALAVFFLTDPVKRDSPEPTTENVSASEYVSVEYEEPEPKSDLEEAVHEVLVTLNAGRYSGECLTEGHITLGTDKKDGGVKVYLLTDITSYGFENGYFTSFGGSLVPTVLIFREENGAYVFEELIEAEDGDYYVPSIKKMYPNKYHSRVLGEWSEKDRVSMIKQCESQARAYLYSIGRHEEIRSWSDIEHPMLFSVGISVEVDEKINDAMRYIDHYQLYFGYKERVEDGVRYIYRAAYDKENNAVVYTKEDYESGETLYRYAFDGATGEMLLPVSVGFAEDIDLVRENVRDARNIALSISSRLEKEACAADEHWNAMINEVYREPLGMAGLFDGIEVYRTDYSVIKLKSSGTGELSSDTAVEKREVTEYIFIYYTSAGESTVAGALTYDDIKKLYANEDNAGDDEALLRTAAGDLMKNLRPSDAQ